MSLGFKRLNNSDTEFQEHPTIGLVTATLFWRRDTHGPQETLSSPSEKTSRSNSDAMRRK